MNEPPHVPPRDSYNRTANRNPTTRTCCHSNRLTSRGRQPIPRRHQEEQLRHPMELLRDLPIGRRAVVVIRPYHSLTYEWLGVEAFEDFPFSVSIMAASRNAGAQTHSNSLSSTVYPRPLKNRVIEIGETWIGLHGRK